MLEIFETSPPFDFNLIRSKSAVENSGLMIANYKRYKSDLFDLASIYHLLGKSLTYLDIPIQTLISVGEKSEEEKKGRPSGDARPALVISTHLNALLSRRVALVRRLHPQIQTLAIELFGLSRKCLEKLPLEEHGTDSCRGYDPTLFEEGICHYKLRETGVALTSFRRALKIYEGKEEWAPPLNSELGIADCLLYIGMCLMAHGNNEEAKKSLQESLRISTILGVKDNIQRAGNLLKKLDQNG